MYVHLVGFVAHRGRDDQSKTCQDRKDSSSVFVRCCGDRHSACPVTTGTPAAAHRRLAVYTYTNRCGVLPGVRGWEGTDTIWVPGRL